MKVLGYILTAAAILVGADIFVASSNATDSTATESLTPQNLIGENGAPPPPPPDGQFSN